MVLRSCNIVNDQVDLSGLVRVKTTVRENQFAQKNDILICARNGSRSLVGKCALIPDLREPASFGAFMAIYRTEYFEFIVHYLRSSFFNCRGSLLEILECFLIFTIRQAILLELHFAPVER